MNKKASYAFRILAGAYLVYLGYSLIKGHLVEHDASMGFMIVGVLFGALGLFFCVTGLLGRRRADKELLEAQTEFESLPQPTKAPKLQEEERSEDASADQERSADAPKKEEEKV